MMYEMIEATVPSLPADQPRYLNGRRTPEDLLEGVDRGIDMFDCVMPTRNARNGTFFTSFGKVVDRTRSTSGIISRSTPRADAIRAGTLPRVSAAPVQRGRSAGPAARHDP